LHVLKLPKLFKLLKLPPWLAGERTAITKLLLRLLLALSRALALLLLLRLRALSEAADPPSCHSMADALA